MNPVIGNIEIIMLIPLAGAILLLLIPDRLYRIKGVAATAVSLYVIYIIAVLYSADLTDNQINILASGHLSGVLARFLPVQAGEYALMRVDALASFTMMLAGIFTVLVLLYSVFYFNGPNRVRNFHSLVLFTMWASAGAFMSDSLFMFIFFWGILGFTLYRMISGNDEESSAAAKKTFIIIGASDGIMILGLGILLRINGHFNITELSVRTSDVLRTCAFFALLTGSFAKAGAFPLHSWVPDYTKNAAAPSSAYLPASLDKLLGIYFLVRLTNEMFIIGDWIRLLILSIGALTIIIAVMMALVQHNYKKLLGYHAVSQTGYMITGIGLGTVLGMAGGLFHMLNNAVYKSGLFMVAGNVNVKTGKDNLDDLGGMARFMPVSFLCCLVFALSISGVPPFNGFSSKWMIYQAIIDFGNGAGIANRLWIVWLVMTVAGSALTLASFIKLVSGIFMGRTRNKKEHAREVNILMLIPVIVLALICAVTGILASGWFIPSFLEPLTGSITVTGLWDSASVSLMIAISLVLGIALYFVITRMKFRREEPFIGGETLRSDTGFEPVSFYNTISNFRIFKPFYRLAERKYFDVYELSKGFVLKVSHYLSAVHNGILSNLAFWIVAGMILMFVVIML